MGNYDNFEKKLINFCCLITCNFEADKQLTNLNLRTAREIINLLKIKSKLTKFVASFIKMLKIARLFANLPKLAARLRTSKKF